jgi:hypothetical protein
VSANRHSELVAAVQGGCVGLDTDTARHILASLIPVLRRQITGDLAAMCSKHGLPHNDQGCHCDYAIAVVGGIA